MNTPLAPPRAAFVRFTATAAALLRVLAVILALVSPAAPSLASELHGPVVNPANGHEYYLYIGNTTQDGIDHTEWNDAEAVAVSLGGDLATINDAAESDFVLATFGSYAGKDRSLWIGLYKVGGQGGFVWVSGEPVTFTNWQAGQPDGFG